MSSVNHFKDTLEVLSKAHPNTCCYIIRGADKELIHCLCECAYILEGNIPLSLTEHNCLKRYKDHLRALVDTDTSDRDRKEILQTGGFLPALLAPLAASVFAPIATQVIGKAFGL